MPRRFAAPMSPSWALGPTGLVLALWLTMLGVRVRIDNKTAEPGTTSRAIVVAARTLELYRQIGLADAVIARGRKMGRHQSLWVGAALVARVVFGDMGVGISPCPYALIFPQDEHESLLIDRLTQTGVESSARQSWCRSRRSRVVCSLDSSDRANH
jgi:2-polyprenyl-6-methoxyphenol hydroxylase-like FAD-dependent oxidoreductase